MNNSMRRIGASVIIASFLGLTVTACGDDAMEEFNDAPRGDVNDAPADIIAYPDGFGNVAAKCHGRNMVYSARVNAEGSGRAIAVVPGDARCEGGRP